MKKLFSIFVISFGFLGLMNNSVKADLEPVAVVELYTSQGCSSCPPADAFLGELSMRSDVLALSFHVDYWDYIGWKDPFAKNAYTLRQREYARTFNLRYIYTPQMVVNGSYETSGNKRRSVIASIEDQLSEPPILSMRLNGNQLILDGTNEAAPAYVYHVTYMEEKKTDVRRGENRGRTLTHYHIVRDLNEIGQWQGGRSEFLIETSSLDANMKHALFVQRSDDLKIIAASRMQHK